MSSAVLAMPENYEVLDAEEMTYVEGGGTVTFKIGSNSLIMTIIAGLGANASAGAITAALDAAAVAIAASIEVGTAGTGTLAAGAIVLGISSIAPAIAGIVVGYGLDNLKGKTFKYSNKLLPTTTITI